MTLAATGRFGASFKYDAQLIHRPRSMTGDPTQTSSPRVHMAFGDDVHNTTELESAAGMQKQRRSVGVHMVRVRVRQESDGDGQDS